MKKMLSLISAFFICGSFAFADITTAKKHEASSAYVNAIIEYCKASASDTWCMRGKGDGSVCMTYLDFNYKPQSKQIIKK